MDELLQKVKDNLILSHDEDDELLRGYIRAAVSYAESYQHILRALCGQSYAAHHRTGCYHAVLSFLRKPGWLNRRLLRR